jgi:Rhodopirellula transposase DDE domain
MKLRSAATTRAEGSRPPARLWTSGSGARGWGKKRSATDATLAQDLLRLVEPATLGDPMTPLLWVSKSLEKLAVTLCGMGQRVSSSTDRRGHQEPWGIG